MFFNTWTFAVFFVVVWTLYVVLSFRWQNRLMLVASYIFYGMWDWRFCFLLLLQTLIDYYAAIGIDSTEDQRRRKLYLSASLISNFTILGFFKYYNFFVDSATEFLALFGMKADAPTLYIVLPAGISFYTFQTVSYVIDVYRRELPATRRLPWFALFVSYFPHLVAGPIQRAHVLLHQIQAPRIVTADMFASGSLLILIGLARKVIIADNLAPFIDEVYSAPQGYSGAGLLLATLSFGLQIYGDFAGYSDIAIGVSRIFGIELTENFNRPYFATSITQFWRRWHISLSTWLRDYLYIPLGGNRGPKWFVYRNLMITMLLGGLWHGASWNFVVWGGLHGIALAVHKAWTDWRAKLNFEDKPGWTRAIGAPFAWLMTMAVVMLAWVFFRAPDLHSSLDFIHGIFTWRSDPGSLVRPLVTFLGCVALLLVIDVPQELAWQHTVAMRWPVVIRGTYYAALVLILVIFRPEADVPFIYFQF
jgi:D-alanyl-lipoteichoic acid acyltransferase DltB (MBOAT superfamily)